MEPDERLKTPHLHAGVLSLIIILYHKNDKMETNKFNYFIATNQIIE